MRNYLIIPVLTVMLFSVVSQDVNAEWKFGVSIGLTDVDYELTNQFADSVSDIGTDGSESSESASTYIYDSSYDSTELTFDLRNGKHALSYKTTDGSIDKWLESRDPVFDGSEYNLGNSNDVNREEWTFSYAYSINNNWVASIGIYEGNVDWDYDRDKSSVYNQGTINEYSWTSSNDGLQTTTSEGAFIAIAYQNKITDKLFWFGKLGYQTNDLEIKDAYTYGSQFQAVDPAFQEWAIQYFADNYGMTNAAYQYSIVDAVETEGNSTVIGLGLVYAINTKNSITLEYESKTYSYDPGVGSELSCTGDEWTCAEGIDDWAASADEEASYITLRYRYAF